MQRKNYFVLFVDRIGIAACIHVKLCIFKDMAGFSLMSVKRVWLELGFCALCWNSTHQFITRLQTRSTWDLKLGWGGGCCSSYCHVTLCCTVPSSTRRCTMAKHRVGWWIWLRKIHYESLTPAGTSVISLLMKFHFVHVSECKTWNFIMWWMFCPTFPLGPRTSDFGLYPGPYTPKNDFPEWPWTRPNQVISFSLIAHCLFFFLSHPSRPVIIWCLTSGISRMSFHCLYYEFYCICSVDVHVKLVCHAHWLIWAHARSLDRLFSCQCKGICCDRVEQTLPGYFDTDRELMGVSLYQCVSWRPV